MGKNRNFILVAVGILFFVLMGGILFAQNNNLSKQMNLGLQTLSLNQQNDIIAVNNKITALEEKMTKPVEDGVAITTTTKDAVTTIKEGMRVLYENTKYGFRFINSEKCDKGYILVKEGKSQFISVFAPGNKSWVANTNNAAWVSYQIMSLDNYNKMEEDPIQGKPEIALTLKNNYLLIKGAVQDGPNVPSSCLWEVEKI